MQDNQDGVTAIPFNRTGDGDHALLFIHGFLDAGAVWEPVIVHLRSRDVQRVTLDLPGMGGLHADDGEMSLRRFARDVARVLREIGKPVVLVGQSMGAQVAELVAAEHPGAVAGLVLLTPVPLSGIRAPAEAVAPFKELGRQPDAQRQTRHNLSHALSQADAELLGRFGDVVRPEVVAALVDAWNAGDETGSVRSTYTGPVLILRGESDPFVNELMIKTVGDRFERVRNEVIPQAGHWAHVEQAHAVADLIDSFLPEAWAAASLAGASDWKGAFAKREASAFAQAFSDDVVLEASTLYRPISGRENVKLVMEAASRIYEHLEFTEQATHGTRQYIEWRARAFGGVHLNGITIIARNEQGAIARVAIHHRPLGAALMFSNRLGKELEGVIDTSYFLATTDLPTAEMEKP